MKKGIFYGVSVGPGDPQLLTLKAVETIRRSGIIAVPETREGICLALEIAEQVVDMQDKTILKLPFPMERDPERQEENHRKLASSVTEFLNAGRDVAMLNLGDVSVYSTFGHLKTAVEQMGYETVMIPGVTSFCAAASAMGIPLAEGDCPIHVYPVSTPDMEEVLGLAGTKVFMKPGKEKEPFAKKVRDKRLDDRCRIISRCGMPEERVFTGLDEWCEEDSSYFSLVIVTK